MLVVIFVWNNPSIQQKQRFYSGKLKKITTCFFLLIDMGGKRKKTLISYNCHTHHCNQKYRKWKKTNFAQQKKSWQSWWWF